MRAGFTYDLRDDYLAQGYSLEDTAEFDSAETIAAIEAALRKAGLKVDRIGGLQALTRRLAQGDRWDFVFNIAEGLHGGVSREAQIPALLDAYGIPYVFSAPWTMLVTLDKALAKTVLRQAGIATAPWRLVRGEGDIAAVDLPFPLFAKPVGEGSSKGIAAGSLIQNKTDLKASCTAMLASCRQPVLVETFLPGREFTVGIIGAGDSAQVLGVMEVSLDGQPDACGRTLLNKKDDWKTAGFYRLAESGIAGEVAQTALQAYRVLQCRDAARVDLRQDAEGRCCVLEVNPIPGLDPHHSDLPILAGLAGMSYDDLIKKVIQAFLDRAQPERGRGVDAAA